MAAYPSLIVTWNGSPKFYGPGGGPNIFENQDLLASISDI